MPPGIPIHPSEMSSTLNQSGLNFQNGNPLGRKVRALEADVEEVVAQVKHSKALKTQMTVLLDKIRAISKSSEYIETSRQNDRVRNAECFFLGVHERIVKGEFCSLSLALTLSPSLSVYIYTHTHIYIIYIRFFSGGA